MLPWFVFDFTPDMATQMSSASASTQPVTDTSPTDSDPTETGSTVETEAIRQSLPDDAVALDPQRLPPPEKTRG